MSNNRLIVFSAPWCVNCKPLKDRLTRLDIPFTEMDIETREGRNMSFRYGVRALPTSLVLSPDDENLLFVSGTDVIDQIKNTLEV